MDIKNIFYKNNLKSSKFLVPFFLLLSIILFMFLYSSVTKKEKKSNSISPNQTFKIGENDLIFKSVNKNEDYLYIEIINLDWINKISGFKFKYKNYNTSYELQDIEEFIKYQGYYLLKIPLRKGYKKCIIKMIDENHNKVNFKDIVLFEDNIEDVNYIEEKDTYYKIDYLKFLIDLEREKSSKLEKNIEEKNEEIKLNTKNIYLLKEQLNFNVDEEKNEIQSKINALNEDIKNKNNDILSLENKIIISKNKVIVLNNQIDYLQTGIKKEVKLIEKKTKTNPEKDEKIIDKKTTVDDVDFIEKPKENIDTSVSNLTTNSTVAPIKNETNTINKPIEIKPKPKEKTTEKNKKEVIKKELVKPDFNKKNEINTDNKPIKIKPKQDDLIDVEFIP